MATHTWSLREALHKDYSVAHPLVAQYVMVRITHSTRP